MDITPGLDGRGTYVRVREGRVTSSQLDTDAQAVIYYAPAAPQPWLDMLAGTRPHTQEISKLAFETVPGYAPVREVIVNIFELTAREQDELARIWPRVH